MDKLAAGSAGSARRLSLALEQLDDLLDRVALGFRENQYTNATAPSARPAKQTMTPPRLMAFCQTGKTSISRKFASQSTVAAIAAA
jgi:hypothetical protein